MSAFDVSDRIAWLMDVTIPCGACAVPWVASYPLACRHLKCPLCGAMNLVPIVHVELAKYDLLVLPLPRRLALQLSLYWAARYSGRPR